MTEHTGATGADRSRETWAAPLLTVFVPGLGHWYLRRWRRGAIWFGLYALAIAFLSARSLSGAFEPGEPFVLTALQFESVRYTDVAVPLAVLVVCLLDGYLLSIVDEDAS